VYVGVYKYVIQTNPESGTPSPLNRGTHQAFKEYQKSQPYAKTSLWCRNLLESLQAAKTQIPWNNKKQPA
jgi:tRNA G37 N-methylase TrmD